MKTRTLGWIPGHAPAAMMIATALLALVSFAPGAQAQTTMLMESTVTSGLDANGWLIPGTTTLEFSVTLSLGGYMEAVTALSFETQLPSQWIYQDGSVTGGPRIEGGTSGMLLKFIWDTVPSFPHTFSYQLGIPSNEVGPKDLTGLCRFITGGPELLSNEVTHTIQVEPTTITATRVVTGTAGPGNAYYLPDSQLDITLSFARTGSKTLTAFGFEDQLPSGWTYVGGSFVGSPAPNLAPADGASGLLQFVWFSPLPVLPFTVTYSVAVPNDATGEACLDGLVRFRDSGPELLSNQVLDCYDLIPCLTVTRNAPVMYVASQPFDVEITLESACTDAITEVSMQETLPDGVTFASASGPDGIPAVGATGLLEFTWSSVPSFPYTFTYTVNTAGDLEGNFQLCGESTFTTSVDTFLSGETCSTVSESPPPPTITLLGANPANAECGSVYVDAGATASSFVDGELTDQIVVNNPVDTTSTGTYVVTYNVNDSLGQAAEEVTRTVIVVDTTAPVITLIGATTITVQCGAIFTDPQATAIDACEGSLTGAIIAQSTVNTSEPGNYTITYTVSDGSGHAAVPVVRQVSVIDTSRPTITLIGAATVDVECKSVYADAGATASDTCAGDLTSSLAIDASAVNTSTPGTYTVRFSVTDPNGNTGTKQRTVNVRDTVAPGLILLGANPYTVQCGSVYADPGSTVTDTCDSAAAATVDTSSLNMSNPGTYQVSITARDAADNTTTLQRTVTVVDRTAPEITLVGSAAVTVQCGSSYTDAGATANDACDGSLTDKIVTVNPVDPEVAGVYSVTYNVSDSAGNAAAQVARTVTVEDTQAPVVTLNGNAQVTLECATLYVDAGATATDVCDGDLSESILTSGTVDTFTPGTYQIAYTVEDAGGNEGTATRSVTVKDTMVPVITLLGAANITIQCGSEFDDPGVSAQDSCEGDLSDAVIVSGDVLDTSAPGVYTLSYAVTDGSGNEAVAVTRKVTVVDTQAPAISLLGSDPYVMLCNEPYIDPGAEAVDVCDSSLSAVSVDDSLVDTTGEGTYEVTYTVTDAAGNEAMETRMVVVEGPCATEGEGEGEMPCELVSVSITEPAGDVVIPPDSTAIVSLRSAITLEDPLLCLASEVEVKYEIDGVQVGVSEDMAAGFPASVELPPGQYTIDAIASIIDTQSAVADTIAFKVREGTDNDSNGYLDFGFDDLIQDGDRWNVVVPNGLCSTVVAMQTWFGSCEGLQNDTFDVIVSQPDDAAQEITITVPRALLNCGEQGILIVSSACNTQYLFGEDAASAIPEEPISPTAGGAPFEVSILVSADGGDTFSGLDTSLLEIHPLHISISGLGFTEGLAQTFYAYPVTVENDPEFGTDVVPGDGEWNADSIQNIAVQGTMLSADVTSLALFLPVELPIAAPTLEVSPSPQYPLLIGIAPVGVPVETTISLRNIGSGTVDGAAEISDPLGFFSVVGEGSYSLATNERTEITVRFTPSAAGSFTATLTLSNAAGQPVTYILQGTGSRDFKLLALVGCGAGYPGSTFYGDAAVILIMIAMLTAFAWGRRNSAR